MNGLTRAKTTKKTRSMPFARRSDKNDDFLAFSDNAGPVS